MLIFKWYPRIKGSRGSWDIFSEGEYLGNLDENGILDLENLSGGLRRNITVDEMRIIVEHFDAYRAIKNFS